jgi:hypothetical protein
MTKLEEVFRRGDFIHISINDNFENFEKCFSKMEYIMAFEYMKPLMENLSIETYQIEVSDKIYRGSDPNFLDYVNQKISFSKKNNLSKMEVEFMEKYPEVKMKNSIPFKTDFTSIFNSTSGNSLTENFKKSYLVFTGFNSDLEILINVLNASDNGYIPVVLSDCISHYSERKYFNSLEYMSKFSYVIDSRDVMGYMGDL